jgi:hypothetical protein
MSAALAVLPVVWAYAETLIEPGERKGPARLVLVTPESPEEEEAVEIPEELAFYRKYTEGLLRRYVRLSMEAGRAPSLLGREMFRGNVTHYKVRGFDDVVIFVHDVGQCLEKLDSGPMQLVRRIAMQEYTQGEVAVRLRMPLNTVKRRYNRALDMLTEHFLGKGLLQPKICCQEGERGKSPATS